MFTELYEFLLLSKELSVPGIGSFALQQQPAELVFADKKINPPSYSVSFEAQPSPPINTALYSWLGRRLGCSDREAVIRFNDFSFDLRKQILGGAIVDWDGIGKLSKALGGEIKFTPLAEYPNPYEPISAEKVIRENAVHEVRVGEDIRMVETSPEEAEVKEKKRSAWYVAALIILLLAVMYIGWYLSENGVSVNATSNKSKAVPMQSHQTYVTIPI
ncbi:MAG TPA: hypothetical protein PLU37_14355 [Chitinophagaceae bacterium]|nr:hypothetical protein [Chitinophagales bacterium]HPG12711.1 hypothetical protein [Chitinophagaceae bacterium]